MPYTYNLVQLCDYCSVRETPAQTAARECFEESLGIFGSSDHLLHSLRNYKENNVFKVQSKPNCKKCTKVQL